MSSIPITLVGKTTVDLAGNTVFVGEAFTPGLGFWGGSLGPYPDAGLPGPQPRPPVLGFWGGSLGPYPDAGLPGPQPGGPVRPWGPINYPDQGLPPFGPPPPGSGPGAWRWVYSPLYGWVLDPGEGGKPQPPGGAGSEPGEPPHPEHLPA